MVFKTSKNKEYFLNKGTTKKPVGGKVRDFYYFSSNKRDATYCEQVPDGYEVVEGKRGLPVLRKKK